MLAHEQCQVQPVSRGLCSLLTALCSRVRDLHRPGSRAVAALAFALLGLSSGCTGVNWERDQQAGLRKAVDNRQRAMIAFVSHLDEATGKMDSEVFSDPDVVRLMQRFVAIRLDIASNQSLAEQFGVKQVPAFVVVRPDLTVSGIHQGTMKAEQFRLFLIRNSLN